MEHLNNKLDYDTWHELFDQLISDEQYINKLSIASLICQRTGKSSQQELESVSRSITNWRNGSNLPSRRNFKLISEILNIRQNTELLEKWNTLYHLERRSSPYADRTTTLSSFPISRNQKYSFMLLVVLIGVLLIVLSGSVFYWLGFQKGVTNSQVKYNHILYRPEVTLTVGEKIAIHGLRGKCGNIPSSRKIAREELPNDLQTGYLEIGDLGSRYSRSCGGNTPAWEILFHATKAGAETFFMFNDEMKVIVKEAAN